MTKHKSVLLQEVIESLNIKEGNIYFDATLGGGGHSLKILEKLGRKGALIALDLDKNAIEIFSTKLLGLGFRNEIEDERQVLVKDKVKVYLVKENFRNIDHVLKQLKIDKVSGVLADLGISTDQIYGVEGISYLKSEQLDMRLDMQSKVTASDLLNGLYKKEMIELFEKLADIDFAHELTNEIIKERKQSPLKTTKQLKRLIQKVVPLHKRKGTNKQPEAKVFQALRIAVNDELGSLRAFLPLALESLAPEGRLSVISFHSGEDRIVKKFMQYGVSQNQLNIIEKIVRPSNIEVFENPRSSSAKLRVVSKN